MRGIAAEALALLARYDWPGNVRQLENALFRAVVLADGDELTVAEFPQIAAQVEGFDVRIPPGPGLRRRRAGADARDRAGRGARSARHEPRRRIAARCASSRSSRRRSSASRSQHYRGHMSEVSRRLGIGRSTLYRKLKDLGLVESEADAADVAANDVMRTETVELVRRWCCRRCALRTPRPRREEQDADSRNPASFAPVRS